MRRPATRLRVLLLLSLVGAPAAEARGDSKDVRDLELVGKWHYQDLAGGLTEARKMRHAR